MSTATASMAARTGERTSEFGGTLVEVMGLLYTGHRTGFLHLSRGSEHFAVRFLDGQVVAASSGRAPARLGEVLTACGLLSHKDLAEAQERAIAQQRRLGVVLVEKALLSHEQLDGALRLQVRDILFAALFWDTGSWHFAPEADLDELDDITLTLSTAQLILELVDRIDSPSAVRRALGDLDRPVVSARDSAFRLGEVTLSPADGYVLSRVDGVLSARNIVEIAPLSAELVERSLARLLCAGFVEWSPNGAGRGKGPSEPGRAPAASEPAASAREAAARRELETLRDALPRLNHLELLGLEPGATDTEVKAAYERFARRFHPDAALNRADDRLAEAAMTIFLRGGEAYSVLRSAASRAVYEARLGLHPKRVQEPPKAEPDRAAAGPDAAPMPADPDALLSEAEQCLAQRRFLEAARQLETLLPQLEGGRRRRARLLLARARLGSGAGARAAETELREILREDSRCLDAHLLLADLYRDQGLPRRAATHYQNVLEICPEHKLARSQLRVLPTGEQGPLRLARSA